MEYGHKTNKMVKCNNPSINTAFSYVEKKVKWRPHFQLWVIQAAQTERPLRMTRREILILNPSQSLIHRQKMINSQAGKFYTKSTFFK